MVQLREFYDRKYRHAESPVSLVSPMAWPRTRNEAMVSAVSGGGNYLEVGAGDGTVAASVRHLFDSVTVVELCSPRGGALQAYFSSDEQVRTVIHNIEEGADPVSDRLYGTVVMNAVIEHLVDPGATLQSLKGLLAEGGVLLITTPNVAKWTRRVKLLLGRFPSTASKDEGLERYEGGPTSLYDEGHIHYFTYRSLERLLKREGFSSVERLWYGNRPLLARIAPTLFSDCFVAARR